MSKKTIRLPRVAPAGDWMARGACKGIDTEAFFPEGSAPPPAEAKAACAACPVAAECLDYAIETRQWGVWAGTTDDDRKVLLRRSQRAALAAAKRDGAGLGAEGEPDGEAAA